LTVGIVTTPFKFEGTKRRSQAEHGIAELRSACDSTIVIPNDRLLEVLERSTSMLDAFKVADDVLRQGVQGICDLITMPGLINLDFADVRTIMSDSDTALMGIGFSSSTGDGRAREAAERALRSPLIDAEITGARGILLSIAGGDDLTLVEVNDAAEVIRAAATDDTNIIFGATVDDRLNGQVWVTVVATGFGGRRRRPALGQLEEPAAMGVRDRLRGQAGPPGGGRLRAGERRLGRARRGDRGRGGSLRHGPLRAEPDARRVGRRRRLVPERNPRRRRRGGDLRRRRACDHLLRLPGAAARPGEPHRGGVVGAGQPQAALRARSRSRLNAARKRVGERDRELPSNRL